MAKVTITHTFDLFEESVELSRFHRSCNALSVLEDLDCQLRSILKYRETDWLTDEAAEYLESLRAEIHESGVLGD